MGLRGIGAGPYRVPHLPPPSRLEHKIKCPGCGRWFISSRRDAVVCGATCHQRVVRAHRREEKLNGMQVRRDLKPKAIVRPKHEQPPPDEVLVSADAVRLFKKMCALELELRCDCPDDTGDPDTMCANCKKLWRMNSKLCDFFNVPHWQFAYQNPSWQSRRPDPSALARFHLLEKAAAMAKQK
jgi:hypothetical protein